MKKEVSNFWFSFSVYFMFIPGLLISVFLFRSFFSEFFLLYPLNPTVLSIFGSNYLHTDWVHLSANLFAYLLVIPFIFYFDYWSNKKMLYVNIPLLFVLLPVVVSVLNIVSFAEYNVNFPMKGFSAIAAGVFGYVAYSMLHYIKTEYSIDLQHSLFQLMWFILYTNLIIISLIYAYYLIAGVICFLLVLVFVNTFQDYKKIFVVIGGLPYVKRTMLLFGFGLSLLAGILGLFPGDIHQGTTLVNIFAHYLGYIIGFGLPAIVSEYFVKKNFL